MNGAAAHWLILARSSGSESELSAVRFSTYSFVGGIHERTLRSRHASLRRTGHRRNRSSPILNYQAPGARPDFSRYHGMSITANHVPFFLCCERSRNMDLLPDPNVEIIHDQFAEHHIGPAESWVGIGVRDHLRPPRNAGGIAWRNHATTWQVCLSVNRNVVPTS